MATASIILGILSLVLCSVFTGLPAIILGAMSLGTIGRSRGRITGKGLAITGIVTGAISCLLLPLIGIGLLIPAVQKVREAAARMQNANNLKQISIAMLTYQDAYNTLPPAALCQKNGKKLLSWRVAILPYIEQESLYRQFNLDEPWDGPNNSKLIALMPKTYAYPASSQCLAIPTTGYLSATELLLNGAKGFRLASSRTVPRTRFWWRKQRRPCLGPSRTNWNSIPTARSPRWAAISPAAPQSRLRTERCVRFPRR